MPKKIKRVTQDRRFIDAFEGIFREKNFKVNLKDVERISLIRG